MLYNKIMNLTPLETFREEFGFHPYHFYQLSGSKVPLLTGCNTLVYQYNWQNADAVGRQQIRRALETAESRLKTYLNYAVAPNFIEETVRFPRYPDLRFDRMGYAGADARWITVNASEGRIISAGSEALVSTHAGVAVVYSDSDGDGLNDTFTVTIPTTLTDISEVEVYFSAADRVDGHDIAEYKISPVEIEINAGTLTVKGRSWLLVKPVLQMGVNVDPIDPALATNFVSTVDIYRHYPMHGTTYETAEAVLIWESRPWPVFACNYPVTNGDPAAYAYALARLAVRDAGLGTFGVGEAVYNTTTSAWEPVYHLETWRPPDRVIIRYLAGVPLQNGNIHPRYRSLVTRFAAAELARPICACEGANSELYRWQFDIARSAGVNDEQYSISGEDLNNPFGTRAGQVYAWKEVVPLRTIRGYSV